MRLDNKHGPITAKMKLQRTSVTVTVHNSVTGEVYALVWDFIEDNASVAKAKKMPKKAMSNNHQNGAALIEPANNDSNSVDADVNPSIKVEGENE